MARQTDIVFEKSVQIRFAIALKLQVKDPLVLHPPHLVRVQHIRRKFRRQMCCEFHAVNADGFERPAGQ